jgi:hypothetical protein
MLLPPLYEVERGIEGVRFAPSIHFACAIKPCLLHSSHDFERRILRRAWLPTGAERKIG